MYSTVILLCFHIGKMCCVYIFGYPFVTRDEWTTIPTEQHAIQMQKRKISIKYLYYAANYFATACTDVLMIEVVDQ